MSARRPLILITPDLETKALRRGPCDHYVLDHHYADAVIDAGGVPWVAPYTANDDVISAYLDHVDGVVLSGGDFDVDPSLFGAPPHPALGILKPKRTAFEKAVHDGAWKRKLPTLGICGGMQLMCVLREGGTLFQDLATERNVPTLEHEQAASKAEAGHFVDVTPNTLFASLVGNEELGVNTTHHQAVRELGAGLLTSAVSSDGLIEALEDSQHTFWLGVQWHPEAMPHPRHRALYAGLIAAAAAYSSSSTKTPSNSA